MLELFSLYRYSLAGLRVLVLMTVLVGIGYPLVVTGVAQTVMPWQANGSLVKADGSHTNDPDKAVGSAIIAQANTDDALFYPRPSAAGDGYDMLATGGSQLGPEAPDLLKAITARKAEVAEREGVAESEVPADAVTASASGMDPDISPAYAEIQVPRVAEATGLTEAEVRGLVEDNTSSRTAGVLGADRVNVLLLNIAVQNAAD